MYADVEDIHAMETQGLSGNYRAILVAPRRRGGLGGLGDFQLHPLDSTQAAFLTLPCEAKPTPVRNAILIEAPR